MSHRRSYSFFSVLFLALGLAFTAPAAELLRGVRSPDGKLFIHLSVDEEGRPRYSLQRGDAVVVEPSGLGLEFNADVNWTKDFSMGGPPKVSEHKGTWKPLWGERSEVSDHYNTATYAFEHEAGVLGIEVRAYDAGVAFRYVIDKLVHGAKQLVVKREHTEFSFKHDHPLWAVTSAQGKYSKVPMNAVRGSIERPCILEPEAGGAIAIAEAALVDFARMRLGKIDARPNTLISKLHSPAQVSLPLKTPWRVIMVADTPGQLLENNDLLLNLNEPNKLKDTSWIVPGKVIRDVSLSTDGGLACVDFAVKYGLKYIEFDAGWYGDERSEESDARTVSRRGLDLPRVIKHARENEIGVLLYVNRRHLERDLDDLLPLYKEWGIAGIKFGFVQHGEQKWTSWMHEAIAKCAEYELLVDVHDEYRMTGWQRTYPNFLTAEGIGGDETRPTNEQVLANLFNRMIAGPADHTFCWNSSFVRGEKTTSAGQLGKSVLFFSPLQFLYWYDQPKSIAEEPVLYFFKDLPTTWDDTKVLHGAVGQYAVIARRNGEEWWVGGLTADEGRTLEIDCAFLRPDIPYTATIYTDDPGANTPTKVGIAQRGVDHKIQVPVEMRAKGGFAMRIVPAKR